MTTVPQIEVTISYLEMEERPSNLLLHSPRGKKTSLIRAYKPTVSFYRYIYNTIGEPWLWWERRVLSDDELSLIIQDDNVEIYVLYYDGVPAGYAELDRRKPNEIDLAYMGLIPDFIGQKLGPYLLSAIIDIAWSYEPTRLTVNTCSLDHPKALGIYQKCGFNIYDRNVKTIDDPGHNAP
ncbi:GNAT family N-acetyltransferase [Kiloniella sp. EL199]|uniref:GNAT family N-acetyltransferase n=1 Tax=Kiloniella sp. EL199 TaxID=2107581 RepID=UPI000EA2254D|nr:GNAT family N-acetyltransferase [Kiloniella sp. EL199]